VQNTDASIVKSILAGDRSAYAELVDRHKDRAMTLAFRLLRNREDAEEAIQDAFVRAFKALPRFEWKSSFSTWLYRIVYNVCVTRLGRKGEALVQSLEEGIDETLDVPSETLPPDLEYESAEFVKIVEQEIESLPLLYGSVCTLFFLSELSYDQIVEVTGLPLGTVKVRLFRGRQILRDAVAKRLNILRVPIASS